MNFLRGSLHGRARTHLSQMSSGGPQDSLCEREISSGISKINTDTQSGLLNLLEPRRSSRRGGGDDDDDERLISLNGLAGCLVLLVVFMFLLSQCLDHLAQQGGFDQLVG